MKIGNVVGKVLIAAVCLCCLLLLMADVSDFLVYAEDEGRTAIQIMNGSGLNLNDKQGDYIYFGQYKQSRGDSDSDFNVDPIKWRLLKTDNTRLFLFSDRNIDIMSMAKMYPAPSWKNSTMRYWLNGIQSYYEDYTDDNFIKDAFNNEETVTLMETTIRDEYAGVLSEDKVFLLSEAEAENPEYGFADNDDQDDSRVALNTYYTSQGGRFRKEDFSSRSPADNADIWWLRTGQSNDQNYRKFVDEHGEIHHNDDYHPRLAHPVRPALNIDMSYVLFASEAESGKDSNEEGVDALKEVKTTTGNEWKLTVLDTNRTSFAIDTDPPKEYDDSTGIVTVPYCNAKTGDNEYISAIIMDSDGAAKYYGRVAKVTSQQGYVDIRIKDKMAEGDKLYIFNEQFNGDKTEKSGPKTDASSDLVEVEIPDTGHKWVFDGFILDDDRPNELYNFRARYRCDNYYNEYHMAYVNATSVVEKKNEAGTRIHYTFSISSDDALDGRAQSRQTDLEIHNWQFDDFIWTGDEINGYTKAKAHFVCGDDGCNVTHDVKVDDLTTEVKDPTETKPGYTTYHAVIPKEESWDLKEHKGSKDALFTAPKGAGEGCLQGRKLDELADFKAELYAATTSDVVEDNTDSSVRDFGIDGSVLAVYCTEDIRYWDRDGIHTLKAGEMVGYWKSKFGENGDLGPFLLSLVPDETTETGNGAVAEAHYVIKELVTGSLSEYFVNAFSCSASDLHFTVRTTRDSEGKLNVELIDEDFDEESLTSTENFVYHSLNAAVNTYRIAMVGRTIYAANENGVIGMTVSNDIDNHVLLAGAEVEVSADIEYSPGKTRTLNAIYHINEGKQISYVNIYPFLLFLPENGTIKLHIEARPMKGYVDYEEITDQGAYCHYADMVVIRIGDSYMYDIHEMPVNIDGTEYSNQSFLNNNTVRFIKKPAHDHDGIETAWTDVLARKQYNDYVATASTCLPKEPGSYYLVDDVTLDETWNPTVDGNNKITLCLNGNSITRTHENDDPDDDLGVLRLEKSGAEGPELEICDCGTEEHKYTINDEGLAVVDDDATGDGVKTFKGGYITGGLGSRDAEGKLAGGAIYVSGGLLTLKDVAIIGNGGTAAVGNDDGDGAGSDGKAEIVPEKGGAIYAVQSGVEIDGCTIAGNVCKNKGGAIYWDGSHDGDEAGKLELSGNVLIKDNKGYTDGEAKDSNIVIPNETVITIGKDGLSNKEKIGVAKEGDGSGVFTTGWAENMSKSDGESGDGGGDAGSGSGSGDGDGSGNGGSQAQDPADHFVNDGGKYPVKLNFNNEAELYDDYPLWIGGIHITKENAGEEIEVGGGTVKYDPKTNTVTLKDCDLVEFKSGSRDFDSVLQYMGSEQLTVIVEGTNVLTAGGGFVSGGKLVGGEVLQGIRCAGPLALKGGRDSALSIEGGISQLYDSEGKHIGGSGIIAGGTITVDGLIIQAFGNYAPAVIGEMKSDDPYYVQESEDRTTWSLIDKTSDKKYVRAIHHTHTFKYEAGTGDKAGTITATCTDELGCKYHNEPITIKLHTEDFVYDGKGKGNVIDGLPKIEVEGLEKPMVMYYKTAEPGSTEPVGEPLSEVPADAGSYVAMITLGGSYPVVTPFAIDKSIPTFTVTANEITTDPDISALVLTRSDESVPGTIRLVEMELEYGTNIYNWIFEPLDKVNYETVTGTVEITVKADHNWGDWEVTKEPEPNKNGKRQRKCKTCGKVESETIAASGKLLAKMTTKGKTSLVITWNKVSGAAGYEVYFAKCNHKSKKNICKKIKTVKAGKKLKYIKKKLKKKTSYKMFVMAYKMVNGRKVYTDNSLTMHAFTTGGNKKFTNAVKVTAKKSKYTLKVGKTGKIKAKVKLQKKKRKISRHTAKFRYISSLKNVATVTKKGVIKAKKKGTCKVYVISPNGVRKTIKVIVK